MTYTYDAWGRELSWSTLNSGYAGLLYGNPLTYRGYIYDRETGFYYLQSRYYDPAIGRFFNADDTAFLGTSGTLLGWNLFGYCENGITSSSDSFGFLYISYNSIDRIIASIKYMSTAFKLINGKSMWGTIASIAVPILAPVLRC